jgi:hypothetical protein
MSKIIKFIKYSDYSEDLWNTTFNEVLNNNKNLNNTFCQCDLLPTGIKITFKFE